MRFYKTKTTDKLLDFLIEKCNGCSKKYIGIQFSSVFGHPEVEFSIDTDRIPELIGFVDHYYFVKFPLKMEYE